jgi:hypothetical protein
MKRISDIIFIIIKLTTQCRLQVDQDCNATDLSGSLHG